VADQIIFTSAVRGIKPGASGYCTVLRSPGIRAALEQALEKISVFEHTKCNRGRVTYSYRQIEIRDTTYYALSRISDADKDYTGRTNFLAHHLVFQKEEIPDLSPADILLNWSGWCQQWKGEPREEPVDVQSLQQIPAIKPPVRIWKEQAIGADGAIKLASDTQSAFILRSQECTDSSLLQLLAEALSVRAKFNQSYKHSWTTTFSVGLAAVGSAKTFKWLALRATDDHALPKAGTVIDLDTTLPGSTTANEELSAIAREGEFRPAPKPIPLSSEKSVIDRLSTPESGRGAPQRGQRGRSAGKHEPRPIKLGLGNPTVGAGSATTRKPQKRKWPYALVCLMILSVSVGGVWFYLDQAKPSVNQNYERQYNDMLDLYDKHIDGGGSTDFRGKVENVFRRMYAAKNTQNSNRSLDEILQEMQGIDWGIISPTDEFDKNNHAEAFDVLREYLLKETKLDLVTKSESSEKSNDVSDTELDIGDAKEDNSKTKDPEVAIEAPKLEAAPVLDILKDDPTDDAGITDLGSVPTGKSKNIVILDPINLEDYDKVYFRQPGEEISIDRKANFNSDFKVAILSNSLGVLNKKHFSNVYNLDNDGKSLVSEAIGSPIAVNDKITNDSLSYAVSVNADKLIFIVGDRWNESVRVGEWNLGSSSAKTALQLLEDKFDADRVEIRLLAEGGIVAEKPDVPRGAKLTEEEDVSRGLFDAMSTSSGADDISEKTLGLFEEWVANEIISQLKKLVEEVKKKKNSKVGKPTKENDDMLISSYREIIKLTQKSKSIEAYFKAYQGEIDSLKSKEDQDDDELGGVIRAVGTILANANIKNNIRVESEDRKYDISFENEEWGVKYTSTVQKIQRRGASELSENLTRFLAKLKDVESFKEEKKEYKKALEIYEDTPRNWILIEFRRPQGDQVFATVKIK
jgi:hypothetical protein